MTLYPRPRPRSRDRIRRPIRSRSGKSGTPGILHRSTVLPLRPIPIPRGPYTRNSQKTTFSVFQDSLRDALCRNRDILRHDEGVSIRKTLPLRRLVLIRRSSSRLRPKLSQPTLESVDENVLHQVRPGPGGASTQHRTALSGLGIWKETGPEGPTEKICVP